MGISARLSSHRGLVEVVSGDGRLNTPAAPAAARRAAEQKFRVNNIFFMKGAYPYSEQKTLSYVPDITFEWYGITAFFNPDKIKPQERKETLDTLKRCRLRARNLKIQSAGTG